MKRILHVSLFASFLLLAACAEEEALCPAEEEVCDGVCTATQHDPMNCGGCGISCYAGEFCIEGACGCPDGEEECEPVTPDLFGLCFQGGQMVPLSKEHELRTGPSLSGMEGPQTMARLDENRVVVVGGLDQVLRVVDRTTMKEVGKLTLAPEAGSTVPNQVIVEGSRAYVVQSGTHEVTAVDLGDPTKPRVAFSVSTGENSNPFAAAMSEGVLWVSLLGTDAVLPVEIHAEEGVAQDPIAIESKGLEGKANPAGMLVMDDRVYAVLNNLDENWAPAGSGKLWSYELATGTQGLIDLGEGCTNPSFAVADGERIHVACTGRFGMADGAIATYSTSTSEVDVFPVQGAPARLSFDGSTLYVADQAGTEILRSNLDTSGYERIAICSKQEFEFVSDVLVLP